MCNKNILEISGNIWEYTPHVVPGTLAYLTIACTTRCNFKCTFCSKSEQSVQDLDYPLLLETLEQAFSLGLQKVELTGGEALLHPHFWDIVSYLNQNHCTILLVTNGSLIDRQTARKLMAARVNVSVSLNSLEEKTFDALAAVPGKFYTVLKGLEYLKAFGGRADNYPFVTIQCLASKDKMEELYLLRDFANDKGYGFIVNRAIPVGGLQADNVPDPEVLRAFLQSASDVPVELPFSGDAPCNRLRVGCYIGADGQVKPCPSMDLSAGNIRERTLADIWKSSELLENCRTISNRLKGSCRTCKHNHRCYGCRAAAYAIGSDLYGADTGCFHYQP